MSKNRKKSAAQAKRRKLIVEPLEPRTLFSADIVSASLAADLFADNSTEQYTWLANTGQSDFTVPKDKASAYSAKNSLLNDPETGYNSNELIGFEEQASDVITDLTPTFEISRQLIVIDARVNDSDALLQDVINNRQSGTDFEIIHLVDDTDGIEQITAALNAQGNQKYDAVHIIAHGSDAELQLGSTQLNSGNLQHYKDELSSWSSELALDADLLFYGCDVAQTEKGQGFVDQISQWTGADVASSSDLTGHADLGGNWELEYIVGTVETELPVSIDAQLNWMGTLDTITVTTLADVVNASNLNSIAELKAAPGADGISLREALIAANKDATLDTIILGSGTHVLSISGTSNTTGDLDLSLIHI